MDTKIVSVIIGIIIGLSGGYFWFGGNQEVSPAMEMQDDNTTMSDDSTAMMEHAHAELEVDATKPVPTISVEALKDAKDGYNIHITTTNYAWAPEHVNGAAVQGEGHAHIYVNGVKIARVYGEWFNLSESTLQDGENIVEVTLNANDHSEWMHKGEHIADTVTITK